MSFIKKYAWYGSAVVASALLAVALLLTGPAHKAQAVETLGTITFQAPIQAAGLTETWTVGFTISTGDAADASLTAGSTVVIEWPTDFTVPATPTCSTPTGFGNTVATCATVADVTTVTLGAGNSLAENVAATIAIQGITNPAAGTYTSNTTQGATAGFSVATNGATATAEAAQTAANDVIWGVSTAVASPTTVAADGASTVQVTFTATSTASTNAGTAVQTLTASTDLGTIPVVMSGTMGASFTAPAAGAQTATSGVAATVPGSGTLVVTIKAPSAAGTGTVLLRAVPASGGQSIIIGSTSITFTAATVPGAVASGTITSAGSVTTIAATGGTVVLTGTFLDANAGVPIPGAVVTASTTLGTLTANTNGTLVGQTVTGGSLPSTGIWLVTLNGAGQTGTATVTITAGGISATKDIIFSGAASTVEVALSRANPGIGSAPAAASSANRVSVTVKDASGNVVTGQSPTLSIVESSSGITFQNAAGGATFTDAAAASDATTFGGAAPTAVDGISRGYFTIPTTAVAGTVYTVKAVVGTKSGTATLTVAGPVSTVTVTSDPTNPATAGTSTITVTALDALGNPAQDGSTLAVAASAGAVVNCSATTLAGVGTCVFAAPGTAQNVNVTAVVTSGTTVKTGTGTVSVGGAAPTTPAPTEGAGTFDREIPNVGVNTAVYNGGTVDQLSAATAAAGGISVTVFIEGKATVLIPGAPAFVNAAFNAAFPDGTVPSGTIVLVVK